MSLTQEQIDELFERSKDDRAIIVGSEVRQLCALATKALEALTREQPQPDKWNPRVLAHWFHETYERLAPQFGYQTREETRQFDPDSPNGRLMVAVCAELLSAVAAPYPARREICSRST